MTTEPSLSDTWLPCSDILAMVDVNVLQAGTYGLNFDRNTICATISTGQEIGGFWNFAKGARLSKNKNRK